MLVLSRLKGQTILIGDSIKVHVNRIDRERVKLAIECPAGVRVLRAEILDRPAKGEVSPVSEVPANDSSVPF